MSNPGIAPAVFYDLADRVESLEQQVRSALDALSRNESRDGGARSVPPAFSRVEDWVAEHFAVLYVRRATPQFRWCAQWWRHAEAISRFEALWRAWESLRCDPQLGIAVWYRDHLDHQLAALTGPAGPFAQCAPEQHFDGPEGLPVEPAPDGWWPDPPSPDGAA